MGVGIRLIIIIVSDCFGTSFTVVMADVLSAVPADSTSRELIQYGAEAQSWAIEIGIFSSK